MRNVEKCTPCKIAREEMLLSDAEKMLRQPSDNASFRAV